MTFFIFIFLVFRRGPPILNLPTALGMLRPALTSCNQRSCCDCFIRAYRSPFINSFMPSSDYSSRRLSTRIFPSCNGGSLFLQWAATAKSILVIRHFLLQLKEYSLVNSLIDLLLQKQSCNCKSNKEFKIQQIGFDKQ